MCHSIYLRTCLQNMQHSDEIAADTLIPPLCVIRTITDHYQSYLAIL